MYCVSGYFGIILKDYVWELRTQGSRSSKYFILMTIICIERARKNIRLEQRLSWNHINRGYQVTRNTELREERCTPGICRLYRSMKRFMGNYRSDRFYWDQWFLDDATLVMSRFLRSFDLYQGKNSFVRQLYTAGSPFLLPSDTKLFGIKIETMRVETRENERK